MQKRISIVLFVALSTVGLAVLALQAQDTKSEGATTRPATATTKPAGTTTKPADELVATVGNVKVTEGDINELISGGREMSPQQLAQMRMRYRAQLAQIVQHIAGAKMLSTEAKESGVKLSDEDYLKLMTNLLENHLLMTGSSKEEYEKRLTANTDFESLDAFLKERSKNELFRDAMLQAAFIKKKFPDQVKVTDDEVKAQYERGKAKVFSKPEMVKASHILIGANVKEGATPEDRAKAKKKAQELLKEVKKEGTDFAAMAREHSTGPSAAAGGDLGYFPRKGQTVEPFAKAAFDLKVGEISDVVETDFGYHIIKVTGRRPPMELSLEEVRAAIEDQIQNQKIGEAKQRYATQLTSQAKVEFAPGKKPATRPAAPAGRGAKPRVRVQPKK
jgi:peptidyl-prolyl cis-trans isomerase C